MIRPGSHALPRLAAGLALLGLLGWPGVSPASDYREIEVQDGGTITGRVVLKGPAPGLRYFPLVLFPFAEYCRKISDTQGNIVLQEFQTTQDGGLQDVIVAVHGLTKGKPFRHIKTEFVAVDCMFHPADVSPSEHTRRDAAGRVRHEHPLVEVMENHQLISVVNQDPIMHIGQVFQSERGNIVLNFPLPVSTQPNGGLVHFIPGKRIVQMICGMHEFMQTWGYMVDNPYYAKTRKGGAFTIEQIPPGAYTVTAWHPHLKPSVREVTIRPGETVPLTFEFDAAEVRRPNYETQNQFRIGPEFHQHGDLTGDFDERVITQ